MPDSGSPSVLSMVEGYMFTSRIAQLLHRPGRSVLLTAAVVTLAFTGLLASSVSAPLGSARVLMASLGGFRTTSSPVDAKTIIGSSALADQGGGGVPAGPTVTTDKSDY